MFKLIRALANLVDEFAQDVVAEGHKAGIIGTAFLHSIVAYLPFWFGGFVGILLPVPPVVANILATVGGLYGIGFYLNRELNPHYGDFWQYYYLGPKEKILDSVLDFTFPLILVGTFIVMLWM